MFQRNEKLERWVKSFRRFLGLFYSADSQLITIELHKGNVTLLSIPQSKNIFKTNQYSLLDFFPKTLFRAFLRLGNLFLLGVSLIMLIEPRLSPFYRWITIFPLALGVLLYIVTEGILDILKVQKDKIINNQTTKRGPYTKSEILEENVKWKDIQIGDILYLTKGEIVPADLILLDSGMVADKEALCMLDTQYYDGKSTLTAKRSSTLTQLLVLRTRQKGQYAYYRKILTGKLEYEAPNAQTDQFHGRLKLKKDPKLEELTIDNFLPKGTKVRQTSWLFGLVVYVGDQTKTMMSQKYAEKKWAVVEDQVNLIYIIVSGFCLFFTLISIIVLLARSDGNNFIVSYDPDFTNGMKIFNLIILYSQLLPANFYLLYDMITLINKFKAQIYLNSKNQYLQVNNPASLSDLGNVDYMLLDKTGTLTTSYYKLDTFLFGSQSFHLSHDQLFQTLLHTRGRRNDEDEEREAVKFASLHENEYLIPLEYDGPMKSNVTDAFNTNRVSSIGAMNRLNVLKSVKTNQNSNIFNQVTTNQPPSNNSQKNVDLGQSVRLQNSNQHAGRSLFQKKLNQSIAGNNNDEFLQMVWQYNTKSPQQDYQDSGNENSLLYDAFMKCLILCHEARLVYLADDTQYESYSKNEEIALTFAKHCGYSLEKYNRLEAPDVLVCKIRNQRVTYKVLGLNAYTYARNLNSIVIQAPPSMDSFLIGDHEFGPINQLCGEGSKNRSLLICKGDYDAIRPKLSVTHKEREELDHLVNSYKVKGIRMIIYATRILSEAQTKEYNKKFGILHSSLTNQTKQLEDLAIEYETNLSLLGMVGFKEELKPDAYDLIQTAKNCNISTWLLSGDQEAQTISCAQALEMCEQSQNRFLKVVDSDKNQIWLQINTAIGHIQNELQITKEKMEEKQNLVEPQNLTRSNIIRSATTIFEGAYYQKMGKFTLVINGQSLNVIQSNSDLMSHFRFLACVCKTVIGFNMSPQHKELVCQTIRHFFPTKPTVLAIGDGYNDGLMMQAAHVGIEVLNSRAGRQTPYPEVNAGDLVVNNLSEIRTLLLEIGKTYSERNSELITYVFYCATYLAMTSFFFNWFCYFTATSINDSMMVFLFMFLFIAPSAMILGLSNTPTLPEVNKAFPALYVDGQVRTKYFLYFYFIESFMESLLEAALTFYACAYMVDYAFNVNGWIADFQMISVCIMYSMLIVVTFKTFIKLLSRGNIISAIIQLFTVGLVVGFVFVNHRGEFSDWNYQQITQQIFTRYNSIVAIIFTTFMCFFINMIIHDVIRFNLFPTIYEQFAFENRDSEAYHTFTNKKILNQTVDQQINVSEIIQKVFVDCASPSPYIQEMLNPGDTKVTEMKLNPITLEMKELVLEQKFSAIKLLPSLKHLKTYMLLLLVYFVGFAFTDYFVPPSSDYSGVQYLIVFGICLILIFAAFSPAMLHNYYTYSHILMLFLFAIKVAIDWTTDSIKISLSSTLLIQFTTFSTMNFKVVPIILYNAAYLIQLIVRIILVVIKTELQTQDIYSQSRISIYAGSTIIILIIMITIRFLYSYYKSVKHRRNDYLAGYQIEQDNLAAQDILSILVPKFVRQSISAGSYTMQQAQDDVSILFGYICDFDNIMKEEGKNVVLMLDQLFRLFDNLCLQHGVQKIETVGYTYMAATGIKQCEQGVSQHILKTEKTLRLVNMAFDMMTQIKGRKYGKGNQIEMKIGIHVGRVIAGVIGHHKPQFSLIGDPVNQTSRVGSTGDTGAITLSEEAFKQAQQGIVFYIKKQKEAKGLGVINTFQVFKERPANCQLSLNQQRWQRAFKFALKESRDIVENRGKEKKRNFLGKIRDQIAGGGGSQYMSKGNEDGNTGRLATSPKPVINSNSHLSADPMRSFGGGPVLGNNQQQAPQGQTIQASDPIDDSEIKETEAHEQYKEKKELLRPNFLLMVSSEQQEALESFNNIMKDQNLKESKIGIIFLWVTYFVITLLTIVIRKVFSQNLLIFVLRAIFLIVLFLIFPFIESSYSKACMNWTYYLVVVYGTFTILFQAYLTENKEVSTICLLELLYIMIVTFQLKIFTFAQNLCYMLTVLGLFLGLYISSDIISHFHVYYVVCAILLFLIGYYQSMSEQIQMFNNLQINEEKKVKQIALVSQLLPTHAYLKMKNSSIYSKSDFIDEFEDVTLLFADIKGFTEYSHTQTPEGVVKMLRGLFTDFDKVCQKYNVYKMYTIGDCYVVMGFTNSAKRNPIQEAINTVKMGFEMVEIIMRVRREINFHLLNMRIGIHTGQVIGGVIGTDIVRYDIYGKDVSIANKMESSGVEGRVQVSETTKQMIDRAERNPFNFKYHQQVDLPKFGLTLKGFLVDWERGLLDQSGSARTPQRN